MELDWIRVEEEQTVFLLISTQVNISADEEREDFDNWLSHLSSEINKHSGCNFFHFKDFLFAVTMNQIHLCFFDCWSDKKRL